MHTYYQRSVRELDPNVSMTDPAAYCAAMLIAGLKHGAVDDIVIQKTKVPPIEGRKIARRLRKQGVWKGLKTVHSGWDDPESGGIAFWMDVGVGTGMLKRAPCRANAP